MSRASMFRELAGGVLIASTVFASNAHAGWPERTVTIVTEDFAKIIAADSAQWNGIMPGLNLKQQ